jgi:predicted nucleic acid-binding protein
MPFHIHVADAWIAATAILLGVPLITNNHADYAGVNDLALLPERAVQ